MLIVGVDPGKSGAIVILGEIAVPCTMPVLTAAKGRVEYNLAAIRVILARDAIEHVFIEKLQPMPLEKGGTIANYNRGAASHLLIGICVGLKIPFTLVAPQTWQKVMLAGTPGGDTKQRSILAAQRLFPTVSLLASERCRKPHDGIADALLIAEYGRRVLAGQSLGATA